MQRIVKIIKYMLLIFYEVIYINFKFILNHLLANSNLYFIAMPKCKM